VTAPAQPSAGAAPSGAAAGRTWRERWLAALGPLLLVLAVLELLRESWPVPAQTDDAYIAYRYARNLVDGLGLVYNPGEAVEGITNLLWTLLVAAGLALGGQAKAVGYALGVASGAGVLALAHALAAPALPRAQRWAAGLAPWLVLSSLPFVFWTSSGMETPLFAFFVSGALAAEARARRGLATAAAVLATATRPEGVLVAAAVYGWRVCWRWRAEGLRVLRGPAVYALLLLALTGFRLAYYGALVPNTFQAKVGGVPPLRGLHYTLGFLAGGACLMLVPAGYAAARQLRWWPALGFALLLTVYVVCVGGDVFPFARFFVPLLPALAAAAVAGAVLLSRDGLLPAALSWGALAAVVGMGFFGTFRWEVGPCALVVLALWALTASAVRRRFAALPAALLVVVAALQLAGWLPRLEGDALAGGIEGHPGREPRAEALALHRGFNARTEALARRRADVLARRGGARLVATGGIGAFGYFSSVPVLDLYGLVDAHVARSRVQRPNLSPPGHTRSDADYVLAREPDYVLIPRRGARMIVAPAIQDLWEHPDFERLYAWDEEIVGYRRRL
jgi:arabinofuranosyltransferase